MSARRVRLAYRDEHGAIIERTVLASEFEAERDRVLYEGAELLGAWDASLDPPTARKEPRPKLDTPTIAERPWSVSVPTVAPAPTLGLFAMLPGIVGGLIVLVVAALVFSSCVSALG